MPQLLDLYSGPGGAATGYYRAGFDVVGVDHRPQRFYPYTFVQADALDYLRWLIASDEIDGFDAIHASPPCQAYSRAQRLRGRDHDDLIAPTRDLLIETGLPWIIENVEGAPLRDPVRLCGSSIGLPMMRHRLFESNVPLIVPPCAHDELERRPAHVYHCRTPGTERGEMLVRGVKIFGGEALADVARAAMEMPWCGSRDALSQAVPPAFTHLLGVQLLHAVTDVEVAA